MTAATARIGLLLGARVTGVVHAFPIICSMHRCSSSRSRPSYCPSYAGCNVLRRRTPWLVCCRSRSPGSPSLALHGRCWLATICIPLHQRGLLVSQTATIHHYNTDASIDVQYRRNHRHSFHASTSSLTLKPSSPCYYLTLSGSMPHQLDARPHCGHGQPILPSPSECT